MFFKRLSLIFLFLSRMLFLTLVKNLDAIAFVAVKLKTVLRATNYIRLGKNLTYFLIWLETSCLIS